MNETEKIILMLLNKKFGRTIVLSINKLLDILAQEDPLIKKNKKNYLENFLLLPKNQIDNFLSKVKILTKTSLFASVFYIEKIPVLYFYDIFQEVTDFLMCIKDYGARSLAYYLGSNNLKNDDLEDVLSEIDLNYYKILLRHVKEKHGDLKVLSGQIMRYAREINYIIKKNEISNYLNTVANIYKRYGTDTASLFIENTKSVTQIIKINETVNILSKLFRISKEYMDFCLKFPSLIRKTVNKRLNQEINAKIKLTILKDENINQLTQIPYVLKDKYFYALLINWMRYGKSHKENILSQLKLQNYRKQFIQNKYIQEKIYKVSKITNDRWFKDWYFAGDEINNQFIYNEIKKLLMPNSYFKFIIKKIFAINRSLFIKIKKDYQKKDLIELIKYLENICINEKIKSKLSSFKTYLSDNNKLLLDIYSKNDLIIKTWDRNPWVDYARSDELYSCTSIGKSADIYAPSYLADINMNNLDIWNNSLRIGRIHLILVKNINNEPSILIDSIEGSDRLMRNDKRLNFIFQAIVKYSNFLSINKMLFNTDLTFNNTPKLFIKYLSTKLKHIEYIYIKRYIEQSTIKETLPYPINSFIETLKNKEEGIAKGFILSS